MCFYKMCNGTHQFWIEFINSYKSLPVLWNTQLDTSNDEISQDDAYDVLIHKLREIEPDADKDSLLNVIDLLKSNYLREFERLWEYSAEFITDPNFGFISGLWYFNHFSFLDEITIITSTEDDQNYISQQMLLCQQLHERTVIQPQNSSLPPSIRPCDATPLSITTCHSLQAKTMRMREKDEDSTTQYMLRNLSRPLYTEQDEIMSSVNTIQSNVKTNIKNRKMRKKDKILAEYFTYQYLSLHHRQKSFVREAIEEILNQARLGKLNRDSLMIKKDYK